MNTTKNTVDRPANASRDSPIVDYLCILDFEATCNDRKPAPRPQEIIEFPTLLLNARTGAVEEEFHHYIKPDVHPKLTEFCTELTGITQSMVNGGIPLCRALLLHQEWIDKLGIVPTDHAADASSPTFTYLTCGDWDLKTCLPSQLKHHSEKVPRIFQSWINIKHEFRDLYGRKAGGMAGMLRDLGLELLGRHHSGIDDCRNIARICQRMLEDGWVPGATTKRARSAPVPAAPADPTKAAEAERRAAIKAAREETKRKRKERRAEKVAQRKEGKEFYLMPE